MSRKRSIAARSVLAASLLVAVAVPAAAQEQPQAAPALAADPLFATLYPPELIMQHRRAIGLTDEQRDAISQMIQDLQGRVVRLQWELLDEVQQLTEITSPPRVDLDRSLDQIGDVLDTENEIKRAHLEMLVRIKNLLAPDQQAALDRLRGEG
jgi:Spy/CpxP family protein refolding chaperone